MATPVVPLITGFSDAASGTAEFYTQGTSTISTLVYSDVDGQTAVSTHPLNASGRLLRFVEEPVDVVIKNAAGATVATFPVITDARTVRLESTAFTGSNPNGNGQTIAGGKTTLHSGLALYRESLGTDDGYVLVNGTEYLIKNALGSAGAVFFNVKTGYGAQGDDTNDDTSAIQAAVNAAQNNGGGIVFFPPGTYKISGSITVTSNSIALMGASNGTVTLKQYTTGLTNGWVYLSSSFASMTNIRIAASNAAHTGSCVEVGPNTVSNVYIEACRLGGHAGACVKTVGLGVDVTATLNACRLTVSSASGLWCDSSSGNSNVLFTGCSLESTVVVAGLLKAGVFLMTGCVIRMNSTTAGTIVMEGSSSASLVAAGCFFLAGNTSGTSYINATSGSAEVILTGCRLSNGSGGALALTQGSGPVVESGCTIGSTTIDPTLPNASLTYSANRNFRTTATTVAGVGHTPTTAARFHNVTHSSGAGMAFANPTGNAPVGTELAIIYRNNTGGAITPTWGTAYSGIPATSVPNGTRALYSFIYDGAEWASVSASPTIGYS